MNCLLWKAPSQNNGVSLLPLLLAILVVLGTKLDSGERVIALLHMRPDSSANRFESVLGVLQTGEFTQSSAMRGSAPKR
jgi:hypothetical protein